ncbi:MAG: ABC transporter permease, partial [Desulfobacterales bacterium]
VRGLSGLENVPSPSGGSLAREKPMIKHIFKIVWSRKRSNLLLTLEIGLTFCFLVFMLITGLHTWFTYRQPLGFSWENVIEIYFPDLSLWIDAEWAQNTVETQIRMLTAAKGLEEVEAAGLLWEMPFHGISSFNSVSYKGRVTRSKSLSVTDDIMAVLKPDLLRGRLFASQHDALDRGAVLINRHLQHDLFGDEDPVGQTIKVVWGAADELPHGIERIIVGVLSDFKRDGELAKTSNVILHRISLADPASIGSPFRRLLLRLRPETTVVQEERIVAKLGAIARSWMFEVTTLDDRRLTLLKKKAAPLIAGAIIGFNLMLMVGLGLTGVLWLNVTRRTREIGLRRANGATVGRIIQQIAGELVVVTTIGLLGGLALVAQVPLLQASDSVSGTSYFLGIIISAAIMYALAILCSLYPGFMATRIQPARALHHE